MISSEIEFSYNFSGRKAIYFTEKIKNSNLGLVLLEKGKRRINAKSILGVLSLGIKKEDKVTFYCEDKTSFLKVLEIIKENIFI